MKFQPITIIRIAYYITIFIGCLILIKEWEGLLTQKSNILTDIIYHVTAWLIAERIWADQNTLDTHKWGYIDEYDDVSIESTAKDSDLSYYTIHNTFSDVYSESLCSESNSKVSTDKFDKIPINLNFNDEELKELMGYYEKTPKYFYLDSEYETYDYTMAWEEIKFK